MASLRGQLAVAEDALERVQSQPDEAATTAARLLASEGLDVEALVVAQFALGRARHEQGRIDEACRELENAATKAAAHGLTNREGHIRGSLALSLFTHGESDRAFVQLDAAESALVGSDRARVVAQRAIILVHSGELTAGLDAFNRAFPDLLSAGDDLAVARLVISRGVVHSLLGDLTRAEADFLDGVSRASALGQTALAASAEGNMAFSRGRRGDIPSALDWFDRARRTYSDTGDPGRYTAILDSDLCEVLLLAGLNDEAAEAANRALETTRDGGNAVDEAEAQLLFARCLLARGDPAGCLAQASAAARLFRSTGRPSWASQADYLSVVATGAEGSAGPSAELGTIATRLEESGWSTEALHVRTLFGLALLREGDTRSGRATLEAAARARNRGTAVQRAQAWHALALSRRATENSGGALRALRAGLRVLDDHRMLLGATELRMRSGVHHEELVRMGLEIALEGSSPAAIFEWVELGRAGTLRVPAARPPNNIALAERLATYRAHLQANVEATLTGVEQTGRRRAERIEREIRELSRRNPGRRDDEVPSLDLAGIRSRLDGRVLLEFFEFERELFVVTVTRHRTRCDLVGSVDTIRRHVDDVAFALRRLSSRPDMSPEARLNTNNGLAASTRELEDLLLKTVPRLARDLVIVPSEVLYRLAWTATTPRRSVTIAPSARVWGRPSRSRPTVDRVALVAGPGLEASADELSTLQKLYPAASVRSGESATVASVIDEISVAGLVHIASHGTFRPASPLFSSLEMDDGPLTLYDLEMVDNIPHTVVLASCNAASTDVMPGGEVMSTALALLAAGVRTVVAPVLAVPDEMTARTMIELHRHLANGVRPAEALSRLAEGLAPSDAVGATARTFLVFGTDSESEF